MARDSIIKKISAREILDSRGNPTIEVEVWVGREIATASVPSGASKGLHESVELRDGDKARYLGLGVTNAVSNVSMIIAPKLEGMDGMDQSAIDAALIDLDGTASKSRLGANAILGVSIAVCKAVAKSLGIPIFQHITKRKVSNISLPTPLMNVINGGKHAGNDLSIQEFMIIPTGATKFSEGLQMCVEVYHHLRTHLVKQYGNVATNVGDEGGYAPPLKRTREALDCLVKAVETSGYALGKDVCIGIDAASSTFYTKNEYSIDGRIFSRENLIEYYLKIIEDYDILSIEDPLHEEDFEGHALLTKKCRDKTIIIGDDLFTTNPKRITKGIKSKSCSGLLLKPNQIGTLTEALVASELCMNAKYKVVVSHRSGDTDDSFIADLATGIGAHGIKAGAPARGERVSKYNQLLRIEEYLGKGARLAKLDS